MFSYGLPNDVMLISDPCSVMSNMYLVGASLCISLKHGSNSAVVRSYILLPVVTFSQSCFNFMCS